MFHPGVPEIARHHPWGGGADTIEIVCLSCRHGRGANQSMLSIISPRNQHLRSVSSIQTSIRLAVATSLWRSHNSWVERSDAVSCRLSAYSSLSIVLGGRWWPLLSLSR